MGAALLFAVELAVLCGRVKLRERRANRERLARFDAIVARHGRIEMK